MVRSPTNGTRMLSSGSLLLLRFGRRRKHSTLALMGLDNVIVAREDAPRFHWATPANQVLSQNGLS